MKNIILLLLLGFPILSFAQPNAKKYAKLIKQHRKEYKQNFKENANAPVTKKELKYLDYFAADTDFTIKGTFTRTPEAEAFEMPTSAGITKPYKQYGIFKFDYKGTSYELPIYQNLRYSTIPMYKDYLFVPFKDLTNGKTTYGGGRYLDIKMYDIKNGVLTLDFNKAYNPYCAYKSEGYACPIPPKENHLPIAIEAGEKNFKKKKN